MPAWTFAWSERLEENSYLLSFLGEGEHQGLGLLRGKVTQPPPGWALTPGFPSEGTKPAERAGCQQGVRQ